MAIRVDYLLKETSRNFLRNSSLTFATVLTVAISLSLIGLALMLTMGVNNLAKRYQDQVEFIIWLTNPQTGTGECVGNDPEAVKVCEDNKQRYEETKNRIDKDLKNSQLVLDSQFIDRAATYLEFQEYFEDQPEILGLVTSAEAMPESFRVTPQGTDKGIVDDFREKFQNMPGVKDVVTAETLLQDTYRFSSMSRWIMLFTAGLAFVASALLMYNSIRTAVFARRREIEVMSLVGATKWFIRIPFMLEALVQGLVGAGLSVLFVVIVKFTVVPAIEGVGSNTRGFSVSALQLTGTSVMLLILGAGLGAVAAGVAVSKYLDT